MWAEYAKDPRMKANIGIRRRLAPLLDNDRNQLELFTALLLSLPGSPVLYYGDEIGMGDNIWLGDRDGVRTPMQWTPDRNAGFSTCNPGQLYLPVIMDPIYGYQVTNVEAQLASSTSLLHWTRRMIEVRKQNPAFGLGTFEDLGGSNPSVLSFVREFGDDIVLCVNNLSRFPQPVELDLRRWEGCQPVELLGDGALPADRRAALPADPGRARLLLVPAQPAGRRALMAAPELDRTARLAGYLGHQRWFAGKGRAWSVTDVRTVAGSASGPDAPGVRIDLGWPGRLRRRRDRDLPAAAGVLRRAGRAPRARLRRRGADADGGSRSAVRRAARQGRSPALWLEGIAAGRTGDRLRLPPRARRATELPPGGAVDRRRRRAEQHLADLRRHADPQGVPQGLAGAQPGHRDALGPRRGGQHAHRRACWAGSRARGATATASRHGQPGDGAGRSSRARPRAGSWP